MANVETLNLPNFIDLDKLSKKSLYWLKHNPLPQSVSEVVKNYDFQDTCNPHEQFCGHCKEIRKYKPYKSSSNISKINVKSPVVILDSNAPIFSYIQSVLD